MADITNLKSPASGHVAHVELTCKDDNALVLKCTFKAGEKERVETVTLRRAKG